MRSLATALESYRVDNNSYPQAVASDVAWGGSKADSNNNSGPWISADWPLWNGNSGTLASSGSWRMTFSAGANADGRSIATLTTPCAYITSYPADPFATTKGALLGYHNLLNQKWLLWSYGPDRDEQSLSKTGGPGGQVGQAAHPSYYGGTWNAIPNGVAFDHQLDATDGWRTRMNAGTSVFTPYASGSPSATLLTAGYTYDATNGTDSWGDIYRLKQ